MPSAVVKLALYAAVIVGALMVILKRPPSMLFPAPDTVAEHRYSELSSLRLLQSSSLHLSAYLGEDFPREWQIPTLDDVYMSVENSVHYPYDGPRADAEWNTTSPQSGLGLIYLGKSNQAFTISLFHELRCLDIVRKGLVVFRDRDQPESRSGPSQLVQHCMNYIRQMVLCRSNLHLESVRDHVGPRVAVSETTHKCRDWGVVFEAAEANFRQYSQKY